MSCRICSESLTQPVCLPCGHVFCSSCITVNTLKPIPPTHKCYACGSTYNIAPLDTKAVPSDLRPFVTPSIRPLCIDVAPSDTIRSSSMCHSTSGLLRGAPSEMARLRAENKELRSNSLLWRKRAEMHGEANLNLLKFARAVRDQASQIARDRNDLENRCLMLKQQLDGEYSYSDEMQKYVKAKHPSAEEPDLGQIGYDKSRHPFTFPGLNPASEFNSEILDSERPRKRSRTYDANE